jgi:hypothetical protein
MYLSNSIGLFKQSDSSEVLILTSNIFSAFSFLLAQEIPDQGRLPLLKKYTSIKPTASKSSLQDYS